jgi:hypothetical protein
MLLLVDLSMKKDEKSYQPKRLKQLVDEGLFYL